MGILTQVLNVIHKHRGLIKIHTFVIFSTSFQNYVHLLQCFNSSLPSEQSSVPSQSFSASKHLLQNLTCRNLSLQSVPPKTSIARWNVILEANELKKMLKVVFVFTDCMNSDAKGTKLHLVLIKYDVYSAATFQLQHR